MASPAYFIAVISVCLCAASVHSQSDNDTDGFNYGFCNPPFFGTPGRKLTPPSLVRMGPNSKYFLFGADQKSINEVADYCALLGLQPAEIRNNFELLSIELFLNRFASKNIAVSLGANDDKNEGEFVEFDGSPIAFHSFAEGQPDNRLNMESCLILQYHPSQGRWVYMDTSCDTSVVPMCMFRTDSECFYSSPLSGAKVASGFQYVGSTTKRDYFVGLKQVSKAKTELECGKEGANLVDFDTGLNNNQMLYDLVKKWIHKNNLFSRVSFWTGGTSKLDINLQFVHQFRQQFIFEKSGRLLNDLSQWPSLEWDFGEPSDSSSLDLEKCVSTILYSPYSAGNNNLFHLSTTNCKLPHYPLCYKSKESTVPSGDDSVGKPLGRSMPPEKKYCEMDTVQLNISLPSFSQEEKSKLVNVALKKPLTSETFRFPWKVDKPWLSTFVNSIFLTGRKVCEKDLVPFEFANVMHNILILYYNALEKIGDPSADEVARIQNQTQFMKDCMNKLESLSFVTVGGLPVQLGNDSVVPPLETTERVVPTFDLILEAYWSYFQIVAGSCHPQATGSKTKWLSDFHHLFVTNFIPMFESRWVSNNMPAVDYGVFAGDMDLSKVYYSLRACAVGAFVNSKIPELYFPRPLYLLTDSSHLVNQLEHLVVLP